MTELQNDRMTDRTKTICPPIFGLGGITRINNHHIICHSVYYKVSPWFRRCPSVNQLPGRVFIRDYGQEKGLEYWIGIPSINSSRTHQLATFIETPDRNTGQKQYINIHFLITSMYMYTRPYTIVAIQELFQLCHSKQLLRRYGTDMLNFQSNKNSHRDF